tara:strand:+ start:3099 stop:4058 length:960 start_codon:yes stop_codon:yes gene_type:complete
MSGLANRRYQTLALSGGGYRGLFTAKFIASCEQEFQAKCADRFDLIAGTSIGALLAAGLAASVPATTLASIMEDYGPTIFRRNIFTGAKRFLFAAPYDPEPILEAVRTALGKNTAKLPLNQFDAPLVITAVNYSTGQTRVFRSKGIAGRSASDVKIEDAILASAAAPTFFPTRKIGPSEYIDGGLAANAPDMVAICDALEHGKTRLDEIYQLSIGTASRREGAAVHDTSSGPGALSWIVFRGLVQSIMAAQEHLALSQASTLLRDRLLRVDQEPAQNQVKAIKSLDLATKSATSTLSLLADSAWDEHGNSRSLRDFFVH